MTLTSLILREIGLIYTEDRKTDRASISEPLNTIINNKVNSYIKCIEKKQKSNVNVICLYCDNDALQKEAVQRVKDKIDNTYITYIAYTIPEDVIQNGIKNHNIPNKAYDTCILLDKWDTQIMDPKALPSNYRLINLLGVVTLEKYVEIIKPEYVFVNKEWFGNVNSKLEKKGYILI